MPFYVNEKCPVCDRQFEEGDDIVTCPECGTPHHRECYKSLGHCSNADKHGTDFSFESSDASETNQLAKDEHIPATADAQSAKAKCISCGEEIDSTAVFCNKCGARQPAPDFYNYTNPSPVPPASGNSAQFFHYDENEEIDGAEIGEIASVVKTNVPRFIAKFRSDKRASWNWGAFVFGPYYLFFRKMYKEGALFLALRLIITLITQGVYSKEMTEFMNFAASNADKFRNPTEEFMNELLPFSERLMPFFAILAGTMLVLHIIIAVFADTIYKDRAVSIVKKVNQKLDEGGHFGQSLSFMTDNQPPLSQREMKNIYLGRLGGTSIFAPLVAYFAYDFITTLISKL